MDGGKPYTLFRNTKVHATLINGVVVSGKVKAISKDSIYIDSRFIALNDIPELEAAAAPSAKATPQEKMKSCNKDAAAKKLSGDERKKFISECLGG